MFIELSLHGIESDLNRRKLPVSLTDQEEPYVEQIWSIIRQSDTPLDPIHLERRNDNYLSIVCGENDFARVKIGSKKKWFSIRFLPDMKKNLRDDPRFGCVENKNLEHWKIPLTSADDLINYKDAIVESCKVLPIQ